MTGNTAGSCNENSLKMYLLKCAKKSFSNDEWRKDTSWNQESDRWTHSNRLCQNRGKEHFNLPITHDSLTLPLLVSCPHS